MLKDLMKSMGPGFWIVFAIGALLKLAFIGAVIYVAWHFVSKFW